MRKNCFFTKKTVIRNSRVDGHRPSHHSMVGNVDESGGVVIDIQDLNLDQGPGHPASLASGLDHHLVVVLDLPVKGDTGGPHHSRRGPDPEVPGGVEQGEAEAFVQLTAQKSSPVTSCSILFYSAFDNQGSLLL